MNALLILYLCCLSAMAVPDADKIRAFEEWARQGSTKFEAEMQVGTDAYRQHRLGVFAKEEIDAGDALLEIPFEQMITLRHIEDSDISPCLYKIWDRFGDGSQLYNPAFYEILTLYLLYEKNINPASKWKAWLDVLPSISEMDNILFWKISELRALTGSPLHKRALDRRAEVVQRFEFIRSNVFRPYSNIWEPEPTEQEYKWAVSIVRSRVMSIKDDFVEAEAVKQPALIPYLDMFRHIPLTDEVATDIYVWNYEEEKMQVKANSTIKIGEEIFLSLGEKANSELLDFHGYIIENNPNDCVHVDVELLSTDPFKNEKKVIYQTSMIEPAKLKMMPKGITTELLRAARVATIAGEEIHNGLLMGGVGDYSLSPRSDAAIANYLAQYCRNTYLNYPTKIEEDLELLKSEDLTQRARMATKVLVAEKSILLRIGSHFVEESERLYKILLQSEGHDEL